MDTQTLLEADLTEVLGLKDLSDEERSEFLTELGTVLLDGALLRYLESCSAEDQSLFNSFVQMHHAEPDLLEKLMKAYPDFEAALTEELAAFKAEALGVLGEANAAEQ